MHGPRRQYPLTGLYISMSSNNLDQNPVLSYISHNFEAWGINYIKKKTLIDAKKNDEAVSPILKHLLFDLSILHLLNFEYFVHETNIRCKEPQMETIILAYLSEMNCPHLFEGEDGRCGFNFSESRTLLLICGWIMAVTDFFEKTLHKLIKGKIERLARFTYNQKKTLPAKQKKDPKDNQQQSKLSERISQSMKLIKAHKYSAECLRTKKAKIIDKLAKRLQTLKVHINVGDLLTEKAVGSGYQQARRDIGELIEMEKKNMLYRQYFWIWLDQKIIQLQYKSLDGDRLESSGDLDTNLEIDKGYLSSFYETCQQYEDQLASLNDRIEALEFKPSKNYKEIKMEVDHDIAYEMQQDPNPNSTPRFSFLAVEFSKFLGMDFGQEESAPLKSDEELPVRKKQVSKKLRKYLRQLEDITMI